jgi:hypothetical protein
MYHDPIHPSPAGTASLTTNLRFQMHDPSSDYPSLASRDGPVDTKHPFYQAKQDRPDDLQQQDRPNHSTNPFPPMVPPLSAPSYHVPPPSSPPYRHLPYDIWNRYRALSQYSYPPFSPPPHPINIGAAHLSHSPMPDPALQAMMRDFLIFASKPRSSPYVH